MITMKTEKSLGRRQITAVLHHLDAQLVRPVRLVIGGGACGILAYGFARSTGDIDIMASNPKIGTFQQALNEVARHYGMRETWLNDATKGFISLLAPNPIRRAISLKEDFRFLKVSLLSRADIVTLKLARGEEVDMADISSLSMSRGEMSLIRRNIEHMAVHRPDRAQVAEYRLAELGWVKPAKINVGSIRNLSEIIEYLHQCGVSISDASVVRMHDDLESGKVSLQDLVRFAQRRATGKKAPSHENVDPRT
jgi:hypothetical protein